MGYMLGNHTWDHPDMTTLSASAQGTEMDQATAEQVSLTGVQPADSARRTAPITPRR